MNRPTAAFLSGALALIALPALAASPKIDQAAVVKAVTECRKLTDGPQRLACYDAAVAKMDEAQAKGDLVTVDREQRSTIRRQAFGLTLPSLTIFDKGEKTEEINVQSFKVEGASQNGDQRWVIRLEGGQVWRQIDDNSLRDSPHAGSTAVISKGALGSFAMKVDGQQQIKVHRDQ
jgi:hypothetical protein